MIPVTDTMEKKPRRHPQSRGWRKHIRREKAGERRKLNPQSKGAGTGAPLQQVNVSELPSSRNADNRCPRAGCGHLKTGRYSTVDDISSGRQVQVRHCSGCKQLYRDFNTITFASLPLAISNWNDCPHPGCGWTSQTKTGHISAVQTDVGPQQLCQCGKCGKHFKPYVEPVAGRWAWM